MHVYLAGEIHSDWRDQITARCADLEITFSAPVTDHDASDNAGDHILGEQPTPFWRDHTGASINAVRTRHAIKQADIVVVRFGEKYRQWNAAFDAGFAHALGKPIITLHPDEHVHALKEVNAAANASCRSPEQVADILRYVLTQP